MKKIALLLMVALASTMLQAQLLWKVSGNGLDKPSYLIGTHHLAPLSITDSIKGLNTAIASTHQVIGELVMSKINTPEMMQMMQQMMMIENDTTLKDLFTPEEYEVINKYSKENLMLDLAMAPKLKPSFLLNNLIVMLYMKTIGGFNPSEQLDGYFQSQATAAGKKISGLETPEYQFNLLYNGASLQRQAELLNCLLSNIDNNMKDTKSITDAYMSQDLDKLLKISTKKLGTNCDNTAEEMALLLDKRNLKWVEILPAMMQESPALIVVGALHLTGEVGLINLLRQKGYQVEAMQ